jgi:hypothetical protein
MHGGTGWPAGITIDITVAPSRGLFWGVLFIRLVIPAGMDIMPQYALNPPLERVIRAQEHLAGLRHRLAHILRQQEDAIIPQFDRNPPHGLILPLPASTFVTMRVGVLIGEVCYNLRSALDYLVFALAELDSGIKQKGTQFPIVDTPKDFAWRVKTWLKGLNSAHVAEIEVLQPYSGCNSAKILADLSNRDKHREFADIRGELLGIGHLPSDPKFSKLNKPIYRTPHPIVGEMHVKVEFAAQITFADGTPIVETLEIVALFVAETLDAFKPDFA